MFTIQTLIKILNRLQQLLNTIVNREWNKQWGEKDSTFMVGRQSCPYVLSAEKKGLKVTELEFAYLLSTLPCETGKAAKEVFFSGSVFTQYNNFHNYLWK